MQCNNCDRSQVAALVEEDVPTFVVESLNNWINRGCWLLQVLCVGILAFKSRGGPRHEK